MKLPLAVLAALLAACACGFLAWQFLDPIPVPAPLTASLSDPVEIGQLITCLIVALAVYASVASALITGGVVGGLLSARHGLARAASNRNEYLMAAQWDAAFVGTMIEPLAHQIIARMTAFDDDRLLLGIPFSPQMARTEARTFHHRLLAVGQVWTIAIVLLIITFVSLIARLPNETRHELLPLMLALDFLVIIALVLCRLASATAGEALLGTISRLPLLEASAPVRLLPALAGNGYAAIARFPAEAAAAIRREMEAIGRRFEERGSPSATPDRETIERIAETIASAIATGFDKRITASLRAAEKLIGTTRTVAQELTTRLGSLPEQLREQYATERETLRQMLAETSAAARVALEGGVDGFRQLFAELGARQVEEIARAGAESGRATERLVDTVASACSRIEEDRQSALAQTIRLVEVIEAYTARLLPAMRRLEASDDRVTRSIGQQEETLARLAVAVGELSGTLEALQTVLGNSVSRNASLAESAGREASRTASTTPESTETKGITQELQSLLDDIDGKSTSV